MKALQRLKVHAGKEPWYTENFSKEENKRIKALYNEFLSLNKKLEEIKKEYKDYDVLYEIIMQDKESDANYSIGYLKKGWKRYNDIYVKIMDVRHKLELINDGLSDITYDF